MTVIFTDPTAYIVEKLNTNSKNVSKYTTITISFVIIP